MRILAISAMLLGFAATGFAQDPNRNRMNESYSEARQPEPADHASAAMPPANSNRMNVEYSKSTVELAGAPNSTGNRMNDAWAQAESSAQADKSGKRR